MPINLIDFYVSAAQDQTLRQDVTKKIKMNWGLLTYISTHKLLHDRLLSPAPVPVPAYRSTTKDDKDSCDSSVSSGSY